MRFSVMGCGRWGSFIAWYLHKIGHEVCVWGREGSPNLRALREGQMGEFPFPADIRLTEDAAEAVRFGEVIAISISSQHLREFMGGEAFHGVKKPVVLCMKGIEEETGCRLSEIATEVVGRDNVAVWLGPGHVQYFLAGIPNCMVIDSKNHEIKEKLVNSFSSSLIRFYVGTDLIGSEIGAAAKNVIGIAAGMLDGFGYASLKGALMARGTREIARLIKALGGNEMSAYGLCHLGDYEATLFSKWSHNRSYGENYVKGIKFEKLAEGVMTSKALCKLGKENNVELPIVESVYNVLFDNVDPKDALGKLFMRSVKKEF